MKLTIKQKAFADYYIELGNATEAYIRAGYKATKREVAEANARKLLGNHSVKKYIDDKMKQIEKSGVGRAIKHQMKALELNNVEYTLDPKDDYDIIHINTIFPESYLMGKIAKSKGKKVKSQKNKGQSRIIFPNV